MTSTIRYPRTPASNEGMDEGNQIITIAIADAGPLVPGGPATYTDITPWQIDGRLDEAPYTCISLEFMSAAQTIGLGTSPVALYGCIGDLTTGQKFLLGILGLPLGALFPQIPIIGNPIGYAQLVSLIPVFDGLAIGTITGEIALEESVTIVARPIRRRDYNG